MNGFKTMAFVLFKEPHVFSSFVHYAHAGVMACARVLLTRSRTTRVLQIFVTSAQLINRKFLAFPSVNFLEIASFLNSRSTFVLSFFCQNL